MLPIAQIPGFPSSKEGGARHETPGGGHPTVTEPPSPSLQKGPRPGSLLGVGWPSCRSSSMILPLGITCILHLAPPRTSQPSMSHRGQLHSPLFETRSATSPFSRLPTNCLFRAAGCYLHYHPAWRTVPHQDPACRVKPDRSQRAVGSFPLLAPSTIRAVHVAPSQPCSGHPLSRQPLNRHSIGSATTYSTYRSWRPALRGSPVAGQGHWETRGADRQAA
jgi:hypothetical protein